MVKIAFIWAKIGFLVAFLGDLWYIYTVKFDRNILIVFRN